MDRRIAETNKMIDEGFKRFEKVTEDGRRERREILRELQETLREIEKPWQRYKGLRITF